MTDFGITPDDLRRLARLVEENGLSELRYEEGDVRVTLRTASYSPPSQNGGGGGAPSPGYALPAFPDPYAGEIHDDFAVAENAPASAAAAAEARGVPVEAPVMGVFYRSSSPEDPPLVEVGDYVEVGQAIGLIEAMKVFSEVKTEHAGRVLAVVAQNKALVQPGDTLIILEGSTEV
ncbi:MAG TPA: biotin/lipoyl-containing protein [Armatimonadaceae bacterium]|nr:biotin/lipoyl-containing protein [Armatimonadaceae bacterium]